MNKKTLLIVLVLLIPVAYFCTKAYGRWKLAHDFPMFKAREETTDLGPKPYGDFTGILTIKDGVPIEMHSTKAKRLKIFPGNSKA